ncbi:MAG: hypothetical protein Q4G68_04380 [Planctomycetia bacterium]|nr:hypothetical protein [Planctomycetia bacterium]
MKKISTVLFLLGLGTGLLLTLLWQHMPEFSTRGLAVTPAKVRTNRPAARAATQAPAAAPVAQAAATPKPEFPGSSSQWTRAFDTSWVQAELERHEIKPPADNKPIATMTDSQRQGDTYGNYTVPDTIVWEKETERLVVEGSLIFHNADLLGSTNATSCDMCHPDAEGTHAETYPKFQVQLGRAALLRDMANWCLENPCRAEPMSGDDPRMRALEAYMQAQRTGKTMKYGKH